MTRKLVIRRKPSRVCGSRHYPAVRHLLQSILALPILFVSVAPAQTERTGPIVYIKCIVIDNREDKTTVSDGEKSPLRPHLLAQLATTFRLAPSDPPCPSITRMLTQQIGRVGSRWRPAAISNRQATSEQHTHKLLKTGRDGLCRYSCSTRWNPTH